MKKTPLRRQSKKKASFSAQYKKQVGADSKVQNCAWCGVTRHKDLMERHHPLGRVNERILAYVYLCHADHELIHDNGKASRLKGWLQPQFDGRQGNTQRPWAVECEANWPDNLKRTIP